VLHLGDQSGVGLSRRGNRGGPRGILLATLAAPLLAACSPKDAPPVVPKPVALQSCRVTLIDADDRPLRQARLALPDPSAFDEKQRLRVSAVAAAPERIRVLVEDPDSGGPDSVTVATSAASGPLTLPLSGPPGRRVTPPFLLLGDREDAAAAPSAALPAAPGARLEVRYRDQPAADLVIGPEVLYAIPIRFIAAGPGLPPSPDFERSIELRLGQANTVWRPLGRRFVLGSVLRVDSLSGLAVVRGRAAGVDDKGRPSRAGLLVEGRDLSIPCVWREDGAPLTPKATARALIERAGKAYQVDLYDGLAGDREAVVLHWRRRDGSSVPVARLAEAADVGQSVAPLQVDLKGGLEAAPSGPSLSLEEVALLAGGRNARADGFDVFVVSELRALQSRPAFKVYPPGQFPASLAGCAIAPWSLLDGTGRYPYGLARLAGELLLPSGYRPRPEDTLFADPLTETAGVEAHKRVSAATGSRIMERGRGLSTRK
jgi:hypothetical protein